MKTFIGYTKVVLLLLSLTSISIIFSHGENFRDFGEYAWYLLIFVMFIRPLRDIFPKFKPFSFVIKFRREFGILAGVFGIMHGIGFFLNYMTLGYSGIYFSMILDSHNQDYSGYIFWGLLGLIVAIPLVITSNSISTSILGIHWKTLQRLSYFMLVFVAIHVYLINKELMPIIMVGIWLVLFVWAYQINKKKSASLSASNYPKWLCVPCGYIYDEEKGDLDGGITPGTKFEDIPDDWRCPICGVGKKDFILLKQEVKISDAKVISLDYLTQDVIELKLDFEKQISFISGQYIIFTFQDERGKFNRSYSVVKNEGTIYTFLIKLFPEGRTAKILKTIKKGDTIHYSRMAGVFQLQNTSFPKVFIATGTGLAPIYAMLEQTATNIKKTLFFGVSRKNDLFYLKQLKNIQNLELHIYLSQEETDGYNHGRINLENIHFDEDCEFYICGNPGLVNDTTNFLKTKGYDKIFTEKF